MAEPRTGGSDYRSVWTYLNTVPHSMGWVDANGVRTRYLEAGSDLYANAFTVFRKITIPLSMPGIVAGTLLTFIPAAGDYINASRDFLGGPDTQMMGNVIEANFLVLQNYPAAAALSIILMAVILVGALFVGGMQTVWAGEVTPARRRKATRLETPRSPVYLERGSELGRFNMGSTVILLFEPGRVRWEPQLGPGSEVRMGQPLGVLTNAQP